MALPNITSFFAASLALTIGYWVALIVQRLFFSRISHIPGPKLAAASTLYQSYYDFFPYRGRFLWKCIELHQKYGPVIRIGPDEVHVDDPSFYSEMYGSATHRRNKSALWYWMDGTGEFGDLSAFMTMDHNSHRMRRSALGTYFSKRMVTQLEPRIRDKVLLLRQRMLERASTKEPVYLKDAYGAMTLDVISMYCFGQSIHALDDPQLGKKWNDLMGSGVRLQPFLRSFPAIAKLILALPRQLANIVPLYRDATDFIGTAAALTRTAMDEAYRDTGKWPRQEEVPQTTIIHSMILSDTLPEHEKTLRRLSAKAATMLAGGMDTTSRALSLTTYHLLKNDQMRNRLMQELRCVMPTPQSPLPSVNELEKLPYLTAAIYEGLRISHGVAGRLVRIAPDEDLNYGGKYLIPRGVTFSQSGYIVHTNQQIYPDPETFNPERFYDTEGEDITDAQRHLVSFGKGTRACPGVNLAWAEMYLAMAAVFGSLSMVVHQTTDKDVLIDSEFFVGALPETGPGIAVSWGSSRRRHLFRIVCISIQIIAVLEMFI